MRSSLNTIVPHYKNDHQHCPAESRCKSQPRYEPTKKVITHPKAEKLLSDGIVKSTVYKNASDFSYGKDTHYVESFNNVMNIFQDKRINFTTDEYNKRARLAVIHWNENVNRAYTSVWRKPSPANRRGRTKKVYKKLTYNYTEKIWKRFVGKINRNLFD